MKRTTLLLAADLPPAGGPPPIRGGKPQSDNARIAELESKLKIAEARIAELEQKEKDATEFEVAVGKRMRPGISRDQAVAAETRQREHDKAKQALWTQRQPKLLEIVTRQKDAALARREAQKLFPDLLSEEFNAALAAAGNK